jgi:hypothetical protein
MIIAILSDDVQLAIERAMKDKAFEESKWIAGRFESTTKL